MPGGLTPILPPDLTPASRRGMRMQVGSGVRRSILEEGFANDVDSVWTPHMQAALRNPVGFEQRGWAEHAIVEADPAAWEVLGRWLSIKAASNRHGVPATVADRARSFGRLTLKIGRELDRLCAHPAYRGRAVLGVEPLVLGCYRVGDTLAATPERAIIASGWADDLMVEGDLWPHAVKIRNQTFTVWIFESSTPEPRHPHPTGDFVT